jgi:hypothetical protein
VQIPDGYAPDIGHFALKSKTGKRVHIRARLINASGKLIDLGRPGYAVGGPNSMLCFEDLTSEVGHDLRAIELTTSDTLTFESVTWWSGTRHPFI